MAKIKLLPDEEEMLEVRTEIEDVEKKNILKILLGDEYSEDANVLSFFKGNWYSDLEKYYQAKARKGLNYQKRFEKLINKMDRLVQKYKIEDAY